jgi:hypothetical protein
MPVVAAVVAAQLAALAVLVVAGKAAFFRVVLGLPLDQPTQEAAVVVDTTPLAPQAAPASS